MRIGVAGKWFIIGFILRQYFQFGRRAATRPEGRPAIRPELFSEMRWRCIGPFREGRTVAISGVLHQPNVFYMAAVNGGVWKTTDFGNTWNPIFDDQATGSVGALAVALSDPNIIYGRQRRRIAGPDLATGDGVYKSTDAGKTWTHLQNLRDAQQITAILVDPKDPNAFSSPPRDILTAPTRARRFSLPPTADNRSRKFSTRMKTPAPPILPSIPQIRRRFMRVCGPRALRPGKFAVADRSISQGSGLFKSTDGGSTWRPLTKGLPTAAEELGRMGIAVAPSQPNRLYASIEAKRGVAGILSLR